MNYSTFRLSLRVTLVVLLIGSVSFLGGCASSWVNEVDDDPQTERHDLVQSWQDAREQGLDGEKERRALELLLLKYPRDRDLLFDCAVLAKESGQRERANELAAAASAEDPSFAEAAALRARIAIESGDLGQADRILKTQIGINPASSLLYESLASLQHFQLRHADSLVSLGRAQFLGAPLWRVSYHRGLVALAQGQKDAAKREFELAVKENPGHRQSLDHLRALSFRSQ